MTDQEAAAAYARNWTDSDLLADAGIVEAFMVPLTTAFESGCAHARASVTADIWKRLEDMQVDIDTRQGQLQAEQARATGLLTALEKIASDSKRDPRESGAYTTLGHIINIADEALKAYEEESK